MMDEELRRLKDEESKPSRGRRKGAASKYSPEDSPREITLKTWCGEFYDIAPIYFAAEVLLGVRSSRKITTESAWVAINKFVLETIQQGKHDNLLRLHKILNLVADHKRNKKAEIDPVRLRIVFINDWLMIRKAGDPARWPDVTKSEILKLCRRNFSTIFQSLSDPDAYKFMRAMGLPRVPDVPGQVAMGRALLGDDLFDELFEKALTGK